MPLLLVNSGSIMIEGRIASLAPLSGSAPDLIGTDEKIRRNFPRVADLMDHIDCKRTSSGENFRCTRSRFQKFGQFRLRVPELVDRIVEDVDRIKAFAGVGTPSLRFIDLDKCDKHVKPIPLFGALRCTPAGFNLRERGFVVFVGADRSDFHASFPLVLRYGQNVDAIVFGMRADELHEGYLPADRRLAV
jgi:hypothetical protein